jgi:CHAT domain-containing protein/tetratricopeptide (TPR) repeat protein
MQPSPLAGTRTIPQQLLSLEESKIPAFLAEQRGALDAQVAWQLKQLFDERESSDPPGAIAVARLLRLLCKVMPTAECRALAAWTEGMACQLQGELETSLQSLKLAEDLFLEIDQPLHAAATLISKLISLAMRGDYAEALSTGLRARSVFITHGDLLSAGKIEQNLGNIYFRRDQYRKAEQIYRTARRRFEIIGDDKQLAQIDNCLASALTWQYKFDAALAHYELALARATRGGFVVTEAEIESNLGGLMLFQGRYDRALDYLEKARRRYTDLGLEHDAAISEKELAEAYLELNLIPEALETLRRLLPIFEEMGMQADLAATFLGFGRACLGSRRYDEADKALTTARVLYAAEQNELGVALTTLFAAQRLSVLGQYGDAIHSAEQCEKVLAQAQAVEWLLRAQMVRADSLQKLGKEREAAELLLSLLIKAQQSGLVQVELHCQVALGCQALERGDKAEAQQRLEGALAQYESLRALLPGEEFRISFRGDKTSLFDGLIHLALEQGRVPDALHLIERARSHTLLELVDGSVTATVQPRDEFETALLEQLENLRSELNWFYHQLHRFPSGDALPDAKAVERLRAGAVERELEIGEIVRRWQQRNDGVASGVEGAQVLPLRKLQQRLGDDTVLVEYFALQGEIAALVITGKTVHFAGKLLAEVDAEQIVRQLRFQIESMRGAAGRLQRHMLTLVERCDHYLRRLYIALMAPLAQYTEGRRLVVVPYGALHYVPFHALRTQTQYLIEACEVCVAPSASVLYRCLLRERNLWGSTVLCGAPDERTPHLAQEIVALNTLFTEAEVRLGADATLDAVRQLAPGAGILHLACHGQFRADNPLFSALRLGNSWLTVRDAYDLKLQGPLVTLSACETGINAVSPGEELLGLVRGFLAGGAASLLVSLWAVDDAATGQLMYDFYRSLQAGSTPAAALRQAQRAILAQAPHPFYWSPFVLFGRWD